MNFFSCFHDVDSSLAVVFLEVSEAAATTKYLGFDNIFHLFLLTELLSNQIGFLSVECHVTQGDGNAVLVKQFASLVLVQLYAPHRQVLVYD